MLRPQPIKIIKNQPQIQQENGLPFVLKLGIIVGVHFTKNVIVGIASATLGPVGTAVANFVGDMVANMVIDVLIGDDPFTGKNFLANFGFPAIGLFRKVATIKRFNKNYLRSLGVLNKDSVKKEFYSLHQDTTKFKWGEFEWTYDKRNYQLLEGKYDALITEELVKTKKNFYSKNKFLERKKIDEMFEEKFGQIFKQIKTFKNTLNYVSPQYAARRFIAKHTLKYKKQINEHIKNWWKRTQIFLKEKDKILYKSLIPLKHTAPNPNYGPWILGIRLFQVQGMLNRVHVQYVFNPKATNKKQPIMLFFRTWQDVTKIINAKSAGQFYIQNIAWGWKIGKIIRQSEILQAFTNTNSGLLTSKLPFIGRSIGLALSTAKTVHNFFNQLQNLHQENIIQKTIQGASQGLLRSMPQKQFLKATFDVATTGNFIYYKRFAKNSLLRKSRQKQKKQWRIFLSKEVKNYAQNHTRKH